MNDKIKKMLDKLDSLKAKKDELVKQRDNEKLEIEKLRVKAGFDLLNGGTIDAIETCKKKPEYKQSKAE